MSRPEYWILEINGRADDSIRYTQRARARGAAMILRAQGHRVELIAKGF